MKICIINLSGNVGKTTIAVHLLGAFNPAAKIISVESFNATAANDVKSLDVDELAASRFKEIYREIMLNDDVVVDVGVSNVGAFMTEVARFKSSIGEFDLVLVPTVPADKQQKDTNATINWLSSNGITGDKIRVLFNQYDTNKLEPIEQTYAQVIGYLLTDGKGKAIYEPYATIAQNEIYEMVKSTGKTIKELASDTTDWKALRTEAKAAKDLDKLDAAMDGQMAHDLALSAQTNLAEVHALLFKGKK